MFSCWWFDSVRQIQYFSAQKTSIDSLLTKEPVLEGYFIQWAVPSQRVVRNLNTGSLDTNRKLFFCISCIRNPLSCTIFLLLFTMLNRDDFFPGLSTVYVLDYIGAFKINFVTQRCLQLENSRVCKRHLY